MPQHSTATSKKSSAKTAPASKASRKAVKSNPAKSSRSAAAGTTQNTGNGEDRYNMIATAAYYRAERRGFNGSCAMDDWLAAEAEIDAMLYH